MWFASSSILKELNSDGCYSTVASGLWREVTKRLGIILESFRCVFSYILSTPISACIAFQLKKKEIVTLL